MQELLQMAARFRQLREEKEAKEEDLKAVKAAIKELEEEMAQEMIGAEVQNFKQGGYLYYVTSKPQASVPAEQMDTFVRRLRARKLGGMVKTTVASQTLSAFVREQLEANNGELPAWLQPLVSVYHKTSIGMRKQ